MTPEEARLNLDATTLRPQDTVPEARALASQDPVLGVWEKSRQAFDEQVAYALGDLAVPADLRAQLLQLEHGRGHEPDVVPAAPTKRVRRLDTWLTSLAVAAVLTVAAVALWNQGQNRMPDWQKQSFAMVQQIDAGATKLDHYSRNLADLKGLLVKGSRPVPVSLPRNVEAMASLGCKSFNIGSREATIVCFEIAPGAEAHLVIVNNDGLPEAPPQHKPQFVTRDGWNIARWSDGDQCYFIATRAPKGLLENLFALLALPPRW